MASGTLKIGTRGSRLALWQTDWLIGELARRCPDLETERVIIRVESDRQPDVPLVEMESRGVFTRDIEVALQAGRIDAAVHSLKDLPSENAPGLVIAATSARADARDALLTGDGRSLEELSAGGVVGTSSLRRTALLRAARPDLHVTPLRGNIDTRLRKLRDGQYDAIVMAAAALERLEQAAPSVLLPPERWVPAVSQGIIGVQARAGDERVLSLITPLGDPSSGLCAGVERSFLRSLGGGCSVPVGGYARVEGDAITLRGFIGSPDGRRSLRVVRSAPARESAGLGERVAEELERLGATAILEELREHTPLLQAESSATP